jgi:hypothetical protein
MIATQPAAKPSPGSAKAAPSAPQVASTDPIAALIDSQSPPAARIPAGAYRIRLSAVRSQGSVAPEWARLKRRYPELATLKNSFSKIDEPGKGVFYRVEAGPLDAAGAKSTCDRLRAEGLGCIVVKP